MNEERKLYASMVVGSHLYGDAKPTSDLDMLNLWLPTEVDMAKGAQVRIPAVVTERLDTRNMLLGPFVMSLGENPENTLVYFAYRHFFPALNPDWFVRKSTMEKMLRSAKAMFDNGGSNPKTLGHAFRYLVGASHFDCYLDGESPYPLTGRNLEIYKSYRDGTFDGETADWMWDKMFEVLDLKEDEPRDLKRMADWVVEEYWIGLGW